MRTGPKRLIENDNPFQNSKRPFELALHRVCSLRGILAVFEFGRALGILECIMSLHTMCWAMTQPIFPSSRRYVLVALANFASDTGLAFPSVSTLCDHTGQDERTVRGNLEKLVEFNVITDTGNKTGSTGQIKVYQFPSGAVFQPNERPTKMGVFEEEKGGPRRVQGGSKAGVRPTILQSPIYMEPLTGTGTVTKDAASPRVPEPIPEIPEHLKTPEVQNAWNEWQQHRKEKRKPITPMAAAKNFLNLRDWGADRWIAAIDNSIANGYQGLFEPRNGYNGKPRALSGHEVDHSIPIEGMVNL